MVSYDDWKTTETDRSCRFCGEIDCYGDCFFDHELARFEDQEREQIKRSYENE